MKPPDMYATKLHLSEGHFLCEQAELLQFCDEIVRCPKPYKVVRIRTKALFYPLFYPLVYLGRFGQSYAAR